MSRSVQNNKFEYINITKIALSYKKNGSPTVRWSIMCGKERSYRVPLINVNATFAFFSATIVLNFIFYEQIYARNNGYSAGYKVQTLKEKNNFLKNI